MKFHGIGAARVGDTVSCEIPGHGPTVIAEGHPVFNDHGVPVAFHGHRCVCGCVLLTSLPQALRAEHAGRTGQDACCHG
ncbi:PAAR domain-containing protein [Pseudomonas solani]|uniref:PAAR domain-containing protein n=1 Tax=Pseudomonas solani TaxID=2731552 RepID=A0AAU7YDJ5_9PSED